MLKKQIHVAAAVIMRVNRDGTKRVFATQRGSGEWKDWWEFPGGKIEKDESPEEAVEREIREELGSVIHPEKLICTVEYEYPDFMLVMECYLCTLVFGNLDLLEHEDAAWLSKSELDTVKWLPADVEVKEHVFELM